MLKDLATILLAYYDLVAYPMYYDYPHSFDS